MPTWSGEFSVVLPDNWLPLDVAGERRIADEVNALLERGAATDPAFTLHRGRIERQLRAVVRSVRREPVVMAAVLITVLDDILPLFASLTAAIVAGAGRGLSGTTRGKHQRRPASRFGPGGASAVHRHGNGSAERSQRCRRRCSSG